MPDPLEELAEYAANFECPAPTRPPPFAVDLLLGVPGDPLTPLEDLWQPGDRIEMQVREGIVDAPGGGSCAIWRGRTLRPGDPRSESEWTPTQTSAPDCLPVPEPPVEISTAVAILAVAALSHSKSIRSLKRKKAPSRR